MLKTMPSMAQSLRLPRVQPKAKDLKSLLKARYRTLDGEGWLQNESSKKWSTTILCNLCRARESHSAIRPKHVLRQRVDRASRATGPPWFQGCKPPFLTMVHPVELKALNLSICGLHVLSRHLDTVGLQHEGQRHTDVVYHRHGDFLFPVRHQVQPWG